MQTYTKPMLSGSTDGRCIPVAATATPGTLIHTAIAGTDGSDSVYLWASNVTSAAATLTIEFGGVTTGDKIVSAISIPANSENIPIIDGQPIRNGLVVRAFSGTASAINVNGYVLRIA